MKNYNWKLKDLFTNQIFQHVHKIFKLTMIKIFQDIIEGGEIFL